MTATNIYDIQYTFGMKSLYETVQGSVLVVTDKQYLKADIQMPTLGSEMILHGNYKTRRNKIHHLLSIIAATTPEGIISRTMVSNSTYMWRIS